MSNFYFKKEDRIVVQGATGREGQRAIAFMKDYYTNVVAGVTPGKGGQEVLGVPIFNSVQAAVDAVGPVDISSLYVPPAAIKAAVSEAISAGVRFVHLIAESIPYQDLAWIRNFCVVNQVTFLGPGSLGVLVVDEGRVGFLGGDKPATIYRSGTVSLISRSGGMANEIAYYFLYHGVGLRILVHLGSELIAGLSLVEQIKILEADKKTKTIAVFEEVINNNLQALADFCQTRDQTKRIVICLSGQAQSIMPAGVSFGHAENLIKQQDNLLERNIDRLKKAGVIIINSYQDFLNNI